MIQKQHRRVTAGAAFHGPPPAESSCCALPCLVPCVSAASWFLNVLINYYGFCVPLWGIEYLLCHVCVAGETGAGFPVNTGLNLRLESYCIITQSALVPSLERVDPRVSNQLNHFDPVIFAWVGGWRSIIEIGKVTNVIFWEVKVETWGGSKQTQHEQLNTKTSSSIIKGNRVQSCKCCITKGPLL